MQKIRIYSFVQSLGLLLLCLALGTSTTLANHHKAGHGHMMESYQGMGYDHMRGGRWGVDMFAYVPVAILYQKDLLGLSEQQVQKIRSIYREMRKTDGNHKAIEQIHQQMAAAFQSGQFDLSAYKSALEKAANYFVQARVQTARYAQEALQVLNKDQRTRFLYSVQVVHSWMESHGMEHHQYGIDDDDIGEDDMDKDDMDEEMQQTN